MTTAAPTSYSRRTFGAAELVVAAAVVTVVATVVATTVAAVLVTVVATVVVAIVAKVGIADGVGVDVVVAVVVAIVVDADAADEAAAAAVVVVVVVPGARVAVIALVDAVARVADVPRLVDGACFANTATDIRQTCCCVNEATSSLNSLRSRRRQFARSYRVNIPNLQIYVCRFVYTHRLPVFVCMHIRLCVCVRKVCEFLRFNLIGSAGN